MGARAPEEARPRPQWCEAVVTLSKGVRPSMTFASSPTLVWLVSLLGAALAAALYADRVSSVPLRGATLLTPCFLPRGKGNGVADRGGQAEDDLQASHPRFLSS